MQRPRYRRSSRPCSLWTRRPPEPTAVCTQRHRELRLHKQTRLRARSRLMNVVSDVCCPAALNPIRMSCASRPAAR
jgi:hypothetical protein